MWIQKLCNCFYFKCYIVTKPKPDIANGLKMSYIFSKQVSHMYICGYYSERRSFQDGYSIPYVNEVTLKGQKTTFEMLLASWFFVCFFKRFRSLNAENLGSVGQRAAKLLAVKVGGLKKGLPAGPGPSQPVCPGSIPSRSPIILKVWWLVTLQPFDLQTLNFQHLKI